MSKGEIPGRGNNQTARSRQRAIGRQLQRIYDNVLQERVPDDFLVLLEKLDEKKDTKNEKEDPKKAEVQSP